MATTRSTSTNMAAVFYFFILSSGDIENYSTYILESDRRWVIHHQHPTKYIISKRTTGTFGRKSAAKPNSCLLWQFGPYHITSIFRLVNVPCLKPKADKFASEGVKIGTDLLKFFG